MKKLQTIILVLCLLLSVASLWAESRTIAVILAAKGSVEVQQGQTETAAQKGMPLQQGDVVITKTNALAVIKYLDNSSIIKVRQNTQLTVNGKFEDGQIEKNLYMQVGSVWSQVTKTGQKFEIETPTAVASVKGTEFGVSQTEDGETNVLTKTGIVNLQNEQGSVDVPAGHTGSASPGDPPKSNPATPEDNATWGDDAGDDDQSQQNHLRIEFQDQNGETRYLNIYYDE